MLSFFLMGVTAGAVTGIPIGPVNVAVIDAAYRHTFRRAVAVGLGGAIADFAYATLGALGVTPVIRTYRGVEPVLFLISGIVLVIYGLLTARTKPMSPADSMAPRSPNPSTEAWSGFLVGLTLIVLNPAAVVTWVVIVGSLVPHATRGEGLFMSSGVFFGSFAWFVFVAYLTHRGKHLLGQKAEWIPRIVGILLVVYGGYLLFRAARFVVS